MKWNRNRNRTEINLYFESTIFWYQFFKDISWMIFIFLYIICTLYNLYYTIYILHNLYCIYLCKYVYSIFYILSFTIEAIAFKVHYTTDKYNINLYKTFHTNSNFYDDFIIYFYLFFLHYQSFIQMHIFNGNNR